MEMSTQINSLLTSSPQIRHGRPCIAGTGITVHRIAILHNLGHSPEEIVRRYEHLTIAGVHAALAYYHANKQEVDGEMATDEAAAERVEEEFLRQRQQVA
jgi:uncharacterized protein (DUF433 family)